MKPSPFRGRAIWGDLIASLSIPVFNLIWRVFDKGSRYNGQWQGLGASASCVYVSGGRGEFQTFNEKQLLKIGNDILNDDVDNKKH